MSSFAVMAMSFVVLTGCARQSSARDGAPAVERVVTLELPRGAPASGPLWLHLVVGPLPPESRILVRLLGGDVVGAIEPFGPQPERAGVEYTLPLARAALSDRRVTVRMQLEERARGVVRAPTGAEVSRVELTASR